jgi:NADH-quinone oxidoreductase subunit N
MALASDFSGGGSRGKTSIVALLGFAGIAGVYVGWNSSIALVYGVLRTGGVFAIVSGVIMLCAAAALASLSRGPRYSVTAALTALGALGASVAFIGADLLTILIGLEIAAVSGYALVASAGTGQSSEAAMKYLVQGAVATGLFVLGLAVMNSVYSADGTLVSVAATLGTTGSARAASLGFVALVAAVAFKAGAAPFHSWAPDAYETASSPSSAFLAGSMKLGMIGVLASLVVALSPAGVTESRPFGIVGTNVFTLLGALAVLSIVVGSTVALGTRSYKRMLAYAGVAQVGYALIALAALNPSGAIVFAVTYALATTAAFVAAEAFSQLQPQWDGTVQGLAGMGRRFPLLGAAMTVVLMSLAGIPPLLGFWGKLQAFGAGVSASTGLTAQGNTALGAWLALLVFVGVVGSVVSLGYYGAVVRALFMPGDEDSGHNIADPERDRSSERTVMIFALVLLVLGVIPIIVGVSASVSGFLLVN